MCKDRRCKAADVKYQPTDKEDLEFMWDIMWEKEKTRKPFREQNR